MLRKRKQNRTIQALAVIVIACCAICCIRPLHIRMTEVDPLNWGTEQVAEVEFVNADTVTLRRIDLVVRYNRLFEDENLTLRVTTLSPSGKSWTDTVRVTEIVPADVHYNEVSRHYRKDVCLPDSGKYLFRIANIENQRPVRGVTAVGVNIE